jgi:hypothetical protein
LGNKKLQTLPILAILNDSQAIPAQEIPRSLRWWPVLAWAPGALWFCRTFRGALGPWHWKVAERCREPKVGGSRMLIMLEILQKTQ